MVPERARAGLVLVLLLALACRAASTAQEDFWIWFAENARRLSWAKNTPGDPVAAEISRHLAAVHPELRFELEGRPGTPRGLVITAEGRAEIAPHVEALAQAMPEITGWTLQPFRPRLGTDLAIDYLGFVLEPGDVWFATPQIPPGGRGITLELYVSGVGGPTETLAREAGLLILHAAIGERAALERIGWMHFRPLPADPASAGLTPLRRLVDLFDDLEQEAQ